jgi:hypothetical protein
MTEFVRIVPKRSDWLMRFIGRFSAEFMSFWTTYRLPFQKKVTICYPLGIVPEEDRHIPILEHEMVHAKDFIKWWGPWFMALAILPPGRWFVERRAYLQDIQRKHLTLERAVNTLWWKYQIRTLGIPSRKHMTKWFEERL